MPCAWKRRKWYEKKSEGALRQDCKNTLEGANKLAECICGWRNNIGGDVEIVRFGIFLFIKNIYVIVKVIKIE